MSAQPSGHRRALNVSWTPTCVRYPVILFGAQEDPQVPRINGPSAELAAFARDMGGTHAKDPGS